MGLLLVDGTNAVYRRAAVATDLTPEEVAEEVFERLMKAADDYDCSHMIVAFDDPTGNWRYEKFPEYKGDRTGGPDLVPYARAAFRFFRDEGLYCLHVPRWEADDDIAALAHRNSAAGRDVYTLSSDHDLLQLLALPGVHCVQYAPKGAAKWLVERDKDFVADHFGVEPWQLADYVALVGGKNNLPGVKGVGAKTAAKWLTEHVTIEGIMTAGLLAQDYFPQLLLWRDLCQLTGHAPVPQIDPKACRLG